MKKQHNSSARASALHVITSVALIFVSAILFASSFRAASTRAAKEPQPNIVPIASLPPSGDQPVPIPVAAPAQQGGFFPALPLGPTPTPPPMVFLPSDILKTSVPIATVFIEPVTVSYVDPGLGYVSFEGDFTYDSAVVELDATPVQPAGLTSSGWAVTGIIFSSGQNSIKTVHVTASGPTLTGSQQDLDALFALRMVRVSSAPGDISPFIWSPAPNNFRFINAGGGAYAPRQFNGAFTIDLRLTLPSGTILTNVPTSSVVIFPVSMRTPVHPFHNYVGFQGDFTFANNVVTFDSLEVTAAGLTSSNWNVAANVLGTGTTRTLRVSAFSLDFTPLNGCGALFNLRMKRNTTTAGANSPLIWAGSTDNLLFIDGNLAQVTPLQDNGSIRIVGTDEGNPTPTATPPLPACTPFDTSTPTATPAPTPTSTPMQIGVFPTAIEFTGTVGGTFPAPQDIQVTTSNGASWHSFDTSPWFDAHPTSGLSGSFTTLTPHIEGLIAGTYTQNITFSAAGLPNTIVTVTLILNPPPGPTPTPQITASPASVEFTGIVGGPFPPPQDIQVTTSNGASWHSFDTSPWFDAHPTSGLSGSSTTLTPHTEGLIAGTYTQNITFSGAGLPNTVVTVTLILNPPPGPTPTPEITASPASVEFTGIVGGPFPPPQDIQVTTSNGASWHSFDTSPWFDAHPTSGLSGSSTTLTPHTEGLIAGTYTQNITFSAAGLPDTVVTVTLILNPPPGPTPTAQITTIPASVEFTGIAGGAFPSSQSIQVTTSNNALWNSFDTSPWFDAHPTSGVTGSSTTLTPHTEGLTAGTYTQNITFSAAGLPNTTVVVTLVLTSSSTTPTPTPIATATATATATAIATATSTATAALTPTPAHTPTPTPTLTPTPTPILVDIISLPIATIETSVTNFIQPVVISTINAGDNLVGFQGDFTFNSSIVTFQDPPVSGAGLTSSNWNVSGNVLAGSGPTRTLRVSAFSQDFTPLSGSGILYNLNMIRVSNTPGASTALTWAAPPDHFIFIDTNLDSYAPGAAPPGSITIDESN